jgi:hypothetical protein
MLSSPMARWHNAGRHDEGIYPHNTGESVPVLAMLSRRRHVTEAFSAEREFRDRLSEYLHIV